MVSSSAITLNQTLTAVLAMVVFGLRPPRI